MSEQSTKKFLRIFLFLYLFGIALGFMIGYIIGAKQNYVTLLFILTLPLAWKYLSKKIKAIENERLSFRKGATGEAIVGFALDNFPDEFRVIHDLTTPYGNVDHVVIGPTGAYIIDTKNWKGVVAANRWQWRASAEWKANAETGDQESHTKNNEHQGKNKSSLADGPFCPRCRCLSLSLH